MLWLLNETVPLITQTHVKTDGSENNRNFLRNLLA